MLSLSSRNCLACVGSRTLDVSSPVKSGKGDATRLCKWCNAAVDGDGIVEHSTDSLRMAFWIRFA